MYTIEATFALFLLYVSKVLFRPVLDRIVFSLATPILKMLWAEAFGVLFLVAGIVMICAILHAVEFLPRHGPPQCIVLPSAWHSVHPSVYRLIDQSINQYF